MKNMRPRFTFLILALALTVQLSFVSTPVQAKTTNLFATATVKAGQRNARCRRRCYRNYQLCLRGIVPPGVARCRQRLIRCLRHCGR